MKSFCAGLCLLPLLVTTATAQAEGLYVGAGAWLRRYDLSAPAGAARDDASRGGILTPKVSVGHAFDDTWALEVGYVRLGRPTLRYTQGALAGELRTRADAWFGAVRMSTRLGENLTLFGKLGLDRHRFEVDGSGAAAGLAQHRLKTALYLGAGLAWRLDRHWSMTLELEHFGRQDAPGNTLNGAGIGLQYHF